MKSQYRDKLKETLGTPSSRLGGSDPEGSTVQAGRLPDQLAVAAVTTAAGAFADVTSNATRGDGPAERMVVTANTIAHRQRQQAGQADPVVSGSSLSPTTATPSSSQRTNEEPTTAAAAAVAVAAAAATAAAVVTAVAGHRPAGTAATMATSEERGWQRRRGEVGKVAQLTAAIATA